MGRRSDARDRLIATASELFRERGFASVGVAQLCEAAGVNKGSFYHFFASKRELLLEVIAGAWDETGMLSVWEQAQLDDPMDQLRQYLEELFARHYADLESRGHVQGSLLANMAFELGSRDPVVARRIDALLEREVGAFTRLLDRANVLGDASLDNPRASAQAIVACLNGLVMLAKVRNDLRVLPGSEDQLLRLAGASSNR